MRLSTLDNGLTQANKIMRFILLFMENYNLYAMQYTIFKYGSKSVPIQRILIVFKAILENVFLSLGPPNQGCPKISILITYWGTTRMSSSTLDNRFSQANKIMLFILLFMENYNLLL